MASDEESDTRQELYVKASVKKGALTRSKKALDFALQALQEASSSDHFAEEEEPEKVQRSVGDCVGHL